MDGNNANSNNNMADEEIKENAKMQAKLKKQNSYTYWVNNDPNYFKDSKIDIQPKALNSEEASKLIEAQANKSNTHSAWNTAGTWEEKSLSIQQIEDMLKNFVVGKTTTDDSKYIISELIKCEGEAKCILSRGKKRLGYHLSISLKLEDINDEKTGGTLHFNDLMDDGDYEFNIEANTSDSTSLKISVKNSIRSISKNIFDSINKLKEQKYN